MDIITSLIADPLAQFLTVVSFLNPHAVAVIVHCKWPNIAKQIAAFGLCGVESALYLSLAGKLDTSNLATTGLLLFAATTAWFKVVWKGTGITDSIESATSPKLPEDNSNE